MSTRKINNAWYVDFRFNRRRYRRRSPENSKRGAEAFEVLLKSKLMQGESISAEREKPKHTLESFAPDWLENYVRVNAKPSGYRTKESVMRVHLLPFFGKKELGEITNRDIEAYKAKKLKEKYHPKTVNDQVSVLSRCLEVAIEWDLIESKPRIKRLKQPQPKTDRLNHDELERLLEDMEEPMWNRMVIVAVNTGMRLGELLGLHWSDVDFGKRQIAVSKSMVRGVISTPKNNKTRYIGMNRIVFDALQSVSSHGRVFDVPNADHITYDRTRRAIHRICKRTGVRKIGWHILRHTFASRLAEKGVPLRVVQDLMGHSTIAMTERYAHLMPSSLNSAVTVLEQPDSPDSASFGQYMGIQFLENRKTPQ